jgi:hypothetical protein
MRCTGEDFDLSLSGPGFLPASSGPCSGHPEKPEAGIVAMEALMHLAITSDEPFAQQVSASPVALLLLASSA